MAAVALAARLLDNGAGRRYAGVVSALGSPPTGTGPAPAPSSAAPSDETTKTKKVRSSGWLTAFAITAIVLGAIEIVGGLANVLAPRLLEFQANLFRDLPGTSPAHQAQEQMQRAMIAVYRSNSALCAVNALVGTPVGALLVVGGIGCLALRRWSRFVLLGAFTAALMLDLGTAPGVVRLRLDLAQVNADYFERTLQVGELANKPEIQKFTHAMGSFVRLTSSLTLIGVVALIGFTAIASAGGTIFLLHPRTRARFQPPPPA